jgi:hypothetical protein
MGWEIRSGKVYYYSKVRDGGQVVSTYLGNGDSAHLFHQFEMKERQEQAAQRLKEHQVIARMRKQEVADAIAFEQVRLLTSGVLLVAGFHQHKGTWRRKHDA